MLLEKEKQFQVLDSSQDNALENMETKEAEENIKNETNREEIIEEDMIPENEWKEISKNIPLEFHVELIKHCYDVKLFTQFNTLKDLASIRIKYR